MSEIEKLVPVGQPRLVGRFFDARRACRPVVGDRVRKRFLGESGTTEILVTAVGGGDVEWKRHFFHDSGADWEMDRPRASYLRNYRKMMINSLRRGCEFIPANGGRLTDPPAGAEPNEAKRNEDSSDATARVGQRVRSSALLGRPGADQN